ncbi:hypothetical protein C2G38_2183014 [Gigaspora rosea]|uniref:Uncharacterized protein n=1 Tax=Gigaspora rosea TaxID=44941 RepID=A0A397VGK9_9GLOM|nr:hypothetical protein C2G38_2183014 [Gigaspora rosea]
MGDVELITLYNDIILLTAWDIEDKSLFIDIDSSGLKVSYTDPDDYKAAIVRTNNPIPSECEIFYFEIKIINKGKNGHCKKSNNALTLEYQEKLYFIMGGYKNMLVNLTNELTKSLEQEPSNVFELSYQGKIYFIMGKYDEAFEDLTILLEIEPDNTIALKYRGEINYMMKKYNESITDLEKLLRIKPNDIWAEKAYKLVKEL